MANKLPDLSSKQLRAFLALADHVELRKGRVRVAALPSLAAGWLPGVFAEFMQSWPGVRIDLSDALPDDCIAQVRGGQADFARAASGADRAAQGDLRSRRLCSDRFHLVCRADQPLAKEARITARKLAPWPFIQSSGATAWSRGRSRSSRSRARCT